MDSHPGRPEVLGSAAAVRAPAEVRARGRGTWMPQFAGHISSDREKLFSGLRRLTAVVAMSLSTALASSLVWANPSAPYFSEEPDPHGVTFQESYEFVQWVYSYDQKLPTAVPHTLATYALVGDAPDWLEVLSEWIERPVDLSNIYPRVRMRGRPTGAHLATGEHREHRMRLQATAEDGQVTLPRVASWCNRYARRSPK